MSNGADTEANALLVSLTADVDLTFPDFDPNNAAFQFPDSLAGIMYQAVHKPTNEDLTTTFGALMAAYSTHLKAEFAATRITGAEYTKAFIALADTAMGNATQFLLAKDQAYWQAQSAQLAAIAARAGLETARMQMIQAAFDARTAKVTYATGKIKLATEDQTYGTAKYQLENILPTQKTLLTEQGNAQRAQTTDTRADGMTVSGTAGAQKALYTQQIVSYKRDAENKTVKLWTDAFITMKTVDEGLTVPDQFNQSNLNTILSNYRSNAGL